MIKSSILKRPKGVFNTRQEWLDTRYRCGCGSHIRHGSQHMHVKTTKHKQYLQHVNNSRIAAKVSEIHTFLPGVSHHKLREIAMILLSD